MARFSDEALTAKLAALTEKMPSVQGLTTWLLVHRKRAEKVAEVWEREMRLCDPPARRLAFLYLANDVLQNSRKKGPEFAMAFRPVLEKALPFLVSENGSDGGVLAGKVLRVLNVWQERGVFDRSFIEQLSSAVKKALPSGVKPVQAVSTSKRASSSSSPSVAKAKPAATERVSGTAGARSPVSAKPAEAVAHAVVSAPASSNMSLSPLNTPQAEVPMWSAAALTGSALEVARALSELQEHEISAALDDSSFSLEKEVELRGRMLEALAKMCEEHERKLVDASERLEARTARPIDPRSVGVTEGERQGPADVRPTKRPRVADDADIFD